MISQLSRNAKNNFVQVSQVLLYIIKRQIYFELEIRCLQLQRKYSKLCESSLKLIIFYLSRQTRFVNFLEVKIFVDLSMGYGKSSISSAFRKLRMLCFVLCSCCNIAVAIAYGRLDSTSKRHGSVSDCEYWRRER